MQSENINELAAALSKAQGIMQPATKDGANPFLKSKYATLDSVWNTCRKPLADNGLAVTQTTKFIDGITILITTLMHTSGQYLSGEMPISPTKDDPQSFGSALTYARRYALSSIVGISVTDDDDGQEASKPAKPQAKQQQKKVAPKPAQTGNGNGNAQQSRFKKIGTIDDLLFELSEEFNYTEAECRKILKECGYTSFSPSKSQEMVDAFFEYVAVIQKLDSEAQDK